MVQAIYAFEDDGTRLVRPGRMTQMLPHPRDGAAPLIGSSSVMRAVRERIEQVALTDFTVLIEGESDPQQSTKDRAFR